MYVAAYFEMSTYRKFHGHDRARFLLIGFEAELRRLNIDFVCEIIPVGEVQRAASLEADMSDRKGAMLLNDGR